MRSMRQLLQLVLSIAITSHRKSGRRLHIHRPHPFQHRWNGRYMTTPRLVRMKIKWILKDRIPMPCDDLIEWGLWFEKPENRIVARTDIDDEITVSTMFLGLDHQYSNDPEAPPILFETLVLGQELTLKWPDGRIGSYRESHDSCRYSTYAEAQKGHEEMCARIRARFEAGNLSSAKTEGT